MNQESKRKNNDYIESQQKTQSDNKSINDHQNNLDERKSTQNNENNKRNNDRIYNNTLSAKTENNADDQLICDLCYNKDVINDKALFNKNKNYDNTDPDMHTSFNV